MPRTRCARKNCPEPVEAPGRRFCTQHRRAHAQLLLAQLEALTRDAGDRR